MTFSFQGFISDFLREAASDPSRIYMSFNGVPLSFGEVEKWSSALATQLRARGIERGDRVAVMMKNSSLSPALLLGLARAGITWIPVNAQQRGDGLKYILEHSDPHALICDADLEETVLSSGADIAGICLIRVGVPNDPHSLDQMILRDSSFSERPTEADELFAIMYTSGTTGRPKGVLVTHGMLRLAGEAVRTLSSAQAGDVFFMWEPLYHIGGAQMIVLPLIEDVRLSMVDRFSATRFWEQVKSAGATHIHYLGGVLQILLKQPVSELERQHEVRIAWGAGCTKEIWTQVTDRFGIEVRECYGMTEASSVTTCNQSGLIGSVGLPMPWLDVSIEDTTGRPVDQGQKGEIVVRSRVAGALTAGYWNNPEATANTLVGGALHTGDSGSIDPLGNLWFHGRLTDSVRCKGENVSAWEVEHVAAGYPDIEDCAMIGVAAELGEQDIKLFVKPKAGHTIDAESLSEWLSSRLAPYQNPRYIAAVSEFERTPSERIMKHKLPKDTTDCWDRLANGRTR